MVSVNFVTFHDRGARFTMTAVTISGNLTSKVIKYNNIPTEQMTGFIQHTYTVKFAEEYFEIVESKVLYDATQPRYRGIAYSRPDVRQSQNNHRLKSNHIQ